MRSDDKLYLEKQSEQITAGSKQMRKQTIVFTPQEEKWAATLDIVCRITWLDSLQSAVRSWLNQRLRINRSVRSNQIGEAVVKTKAMTAMRSLKEPK